jgi:hypothetical protein
MKVSMDGKITVTQKEVDDILRKSPKRGGAMKTYKYLACCIEKLTKTQAQMIGVKQGLINASTLHTAFYRVACVYEDEHSNLCARARRGNNLKIRIELELEK